MSIIGPPACLRTGSTRCTVAANDKREGRERQRATEHSMPLFGAHMSIAGGYHNALIAAHQHVSGAVQIFTKAPSQWAGKAISADEVALFRRTRRTAKVRHLIGHDSYLINLASPDEALYRKSIEAFVDE